MTLTAQAILRAKARKTTAHVGPGTTNGATVDPGAVEKTDWRNDLATWTPYWRDQWDERAAIMEMDAGLAREDAERAAYDATLEAMNR